MNHMMHWMSWGGGWTMGLMWLAWLAICAVVVVLVFRLSRGAVAGARHRESAREILDRRFANGEIDREEYEADREILSHSGGYRPGGRPV